VKTIAPEATPPTAQICCHLPISPVPTVPDFEKLPEASVEPCAVGGKVPLGIQPATVTTEFGVAPVIATIQVSPTWRKLLPRELVKVTFPPFATGAATGAPHVTLSGGVPVSMLYAAASA
jgi:hypothetical protein